MQTATEIWKLKRILEIEKLTVSLLNLEQAMGIELHLKFLSRTETRCYPPLREAIVANCC